MVAARPLVEPVGEAARVETVLKLARAGVVAVVGGHQGLDEDEADMPSCYAEREAWR
jgi:hypothetical protein